MLIFRFVFQSRDNRETRHERECDLYACVSAMLQSRETRTLSYLRRARMDLATVSRVSMDILFRTVLRCVQSLSCAIHITSNNDNALGEAVRSPRMLFFSSICFCLVCVRGVRAFSRLFVILLVIRTLSLSRLEFTRGGGLGSLFNQHSCVAKALHCSIIAQQYSRTAVRCALSRRSVCIHRTWGHIFVALESGSGKRHDYYGKVEENTRTRRLMVRGACVGVEYSSCIKRGVQRLKTWPL